MPNEFDPYREALVIEAVTDWPEEYDDWEPGDRSANRLTVRAYDPIAGIPEFKVAAVRVEKLRPTLEVV